MIEGALVNLRPREMADVERNARWSADPELHWLLGDRYARSLAASEASMREIASKATAFDHVWLAIDTKDGVHIGNCRLFETSAEERKTKLGIWIGDEAYRSRGYGTDAVRAIVRFAFDEMNLNRVELGVFDYNTRAIACYLKCGFVEEGRRRQARYARGAYYDVVVMGVLRGELVVSR